MELLLTAAVSLVGYQMITSGKKAQRTKVSQHEIASAKNVYHSDYVSEMRQLEEQRVAFNYAESRKRDPKFINRTYALQRDDLRQQEYNDALEQRRIEKMNSGIPTDHALPEFKSLNVPAPPELNLLPHFKGSIKSLGGNARKLEAFTTGVAMETKKEQLETLAPVVRRNQNEDSVLFKKYYQPGLLENNVLPFEQQKVSPITEKSQALRPRGLNLIDKKVRDAIDPSMDPKPVFELPLTTPRGYNSIQNNNVNMQANKPPRAFENKHVFPGRANVTAETQHGGYQQKATERGSLLTTNGPGAASVKGPMVSGAHTDAKKSSFVSTVQHGKDVVPRGTVFDKNSIILQDTERDQKNVFDLNPSAAHKKPQANNNMVLRRTQKQFTEEAAPIHHYERPQENFFNNSTGALTHKKTALNPGLIESVKKTQQIPQQNVYLTRARV